MDLTAELVAEDVTFLELDDGAVEEVQVAAADGGAGDFEDDVARFDEAWFGDIDCDVERVGLVVDVQRWAWVE